MLIASGKGVTLIELLVVIVLLGIAIALVGPLTMQQIDSSRARNEKLKFERWLQQQSFNAFASEEALSLRLDGKAVFLASDNNSNTPEEPLLRLEHLFFPPQHIQINSHGFITPALLDYQLRGSLQQLDTSVGQGN